VGLCPTLSDLGRVLWPADLKPRNGAQLGLDEGKVDQI
jgi:hypothetical protein